MGTAMLKRSIFQSFLFVSLIFFLVLTGCSSKQAAVNIKVHTEPEGAHIVYRHNNASWIYLGLTPLNVIESISSDQLNEENTITLRAMRRGYLDQLKEWPGDELEDELESKGMIFWTPRLIKATP